MKTHPAIVAALALLGYWASSDGAQAQSARCTALATELRSLGGAGGTAAVRKVAALEKRSAAFGCSNTRATGRPRECAGISAQLNTARRQAAAGGGGDAARRKRVQAEMARLRCGQAPAAPAQRSAGVAPPREAATGSTKASPRYVEHGGRVVELGAVGSGRAATGGGIFSMLFGGGGDAAPARRKPREAATLTRLERNASTARVTARGAPAEDGPRAYARGSFGGGSYRTLCVRSCDGYYFPISAVTSRGNFQRDETVCRALCPRTEVALYAHPVGSESERMHAIADGMPYEALPTAFQYRKAMDAACTCAFEAQLVITADGRTAIDVDAIVAYSPATTAGAAEAIAAVTAATGASAGSLTSPADDANGAAAADQPATEDAAQDETGVAPERTAGAAAAPAALVDPSTAAAPEGPAAVTRAAPAIPTLAVLPSGDLVSPVAPATAATETVPIAEPAAVVSPVLATSAAGPRQDVGATAPRAAPVPGATRPTLRVRTIGPAFLQNQ